MIKKGQIFTALFVVLSFWTGSLQAEVVTIQLTAEITGIYDPADLLEGKFTAGDIITGSYIYDSSTQDLFPSNPRVGAYWHYAPPCGISLSTGSFVFQTNPDDVEFLVGIYNRSDGDGYLLRSYNNLLLSSGVEVDHISWQLDDYSATALSSDALPTTPPILEDWENNNLLIKFGDKGSSGISARVTTAVPEPATILLLALGSLLLTRRRR